jgi:gliding motility-associated-like protein
MNFWKGLLLGALACLTLSDALAQCNALRPQIDISFNTDQDCAPVTVTQFNITYYFNVAQDPNDIEIIYEWNDPTNAITVVNLGSGLIAGAGNTSFTANATFTYTDNNGQCAIIPTASIIIAGTLCPTSSQTQTAFFWGTDEQANGVVQMNPNAWDVCFNNPVVNAVFADNSEFNCNIAIEPDNPNRFARHVQFVYGTNHNAAATIRNLSLNDGAVQGLTDATGNLVSSSTRGSGALQVTGAYFGPVDAIPFPADAPTSVTFPMSAPANVNNLVGNRFEITLFNWNICNPWNGDPINPNYEDAVVTTGYIVIVDAPDPSFESRDNNGVATKNFCINEAIFFANQTPGLNGFQYTWEFYDDAAGTVLLGTSNQINPQFSFATGGTKLIRLIASNPTAQGSCVEEFTDVVNITPSLAAQIQLTDFSDNPIPGEFCQTGAAPFTDFEVRFRDVSVGTITASTRWRWEFYDGGNNLIRQEPGGGGFSTTALGPFDELFTTPGVYRIRLIIRDNVTLCESVDEVTVRVLREPEASFTADRVCEGSATTFDDTSVLNPVNGETINSWEWDLDYDGVTFTPNATYTNQQTFTHTYAAPGTYTVALRVATSAGGCADLVTQSVVVDPLPNASFTPDVTSGCSVLSVTFSNTAVNGQPDVIDQFVWEIDEGSGFQPDSVQRLTDPGFTGAYTRFFENFGTANKVFGVRLRVITQNGCERVSAPQNITVFPGPRSGYIATNYSPFNQNCSPQTVNFVVDNQTQSLSPSDYRWIISDASGVLVDQSTGTTPSFSYQFVNATQSIRDYQVVLRTTLPTTCNRDSTKIIRINPVPSSAFTRDTLLFDCQVMNMRFDATQKGLAEYAWTIVVNGVTLFTQSSAEDFLEFDFNRTATLQQVEVRLVTTNFANCSSTTTTSSFDVPVNDNITVDFTASPPAQTLPNATVTITNNTTPGPWQYAWDFGDGFTTNVTNPAPHTYATYGTYTITLTVTNGTCVQTVSQSVQINPIPPVVDFTYDPASGCAPLTVTFTNASQFADPSSYEWDFGDGFGTSTAVNPVYTYAQAGIYSVTLSASNVLGNRVSITKSQIIEVFESPFAQFAIKPSLVEIPGGKVFTNNQSTGAASYWWDFGDGTTSDLFEPNHEYTAVGTYTITLVASNDNGCVDTARVSPAVTVKNASQVLIPNAFSPGRDGPGSGDGRNDTFLPLLRGVVEFHMMIFNRWGDLLFETRNPEFGWDGYYNGKLCPQDVYVYKLTAKYENGDQIVRTGDVHLIR